MVETWFASDLCDKEQQRFADDERLSRIAARDAIASSRRRPCAARI